MNTTSRNLSIIILLTVLAFMSFELHDRPLVKTCSNVDMDMILIDPISKIVSFSKPLMDTLLTENENVSIRITATGNMTGHIADAQIQNKSRKKTSVKIPEGEIPKNPGRAAHQGFFVPEPQDIEVPGGSTITVPIQGYCNDPSLDPPAPGTTLPDPGQWTPATEDIQRIRKLTRATEKLQNDELINTPFSNSPPRERENIIQQFIWYYAVADHDPCESIRQLFTQNSGSKYNEYGIEQMVDAIRRVGRATGLGPFIPPDLPAYVADVQEPISIQAPDVDNDLIVVVKGTGRTTGHIADIIVTNPNNQMVVVRPGSSDIPESGGYLIPSDGGRQPYAVPIIPDIRVGANKTVTVPVEGFCVDIRRPPVPAGEDMPPIASWVGLPTTLPTVHQTSDGAPIIHIPTRTALPVDEAEWLLQDKPKPSGIGRPCPPRPCRSCPTFPGTENPIEHIINGEEQLGIFAPIILEGIKNITKVVDSLQQDGRIRTPFSSTPPREREAVIQQTFWIFTSALTGQEYPEKEFESNTYEQFETATGQPVNNLPTDQELNIKDGIEDFWQTFQAVGAEAKILPSPPPPPPSPTPVEQSNWQNNSKVYYTAKLDSGAETESEPKVDRVPKMTSQHYVNAEGNPVSPTSEDKDEEEEEGPEEEENNRPCKCDNLTFDLIIRRENSKARNRSENLHNGGIIIEQSGQSEKVEIDVRDWKEGDFYYISLMRGKMNCSCTNAGSAESIECDFYARSKNSSQKNRLYMTKDPSDDEGVESQDPADADKYRRDFKFTFNPQEANTKVIEFCYSAYCFSKDCNISKSDVRCKDYCLELTFKMGE